MKADRVVEIVSRQEPGQKDFGIDIGLIGNTKAILRVEEDVAKVARSRIPVLITGETGTGKELVARAIHKLSDRSHMDMIPINASAIVQDLAPSLFFGHKRGIFTSAIDNSQGILRSANKNTLFLDEIESLPRSIQPLLLRFLDSGEAQVLGETRASLLDVRVIAAAKKIEDAIKKGEFREDLFYRFAFRIDIPPLRERREDIKPLVEHLFERHSRRLELKGISHEVLELFDKMQFPGNVRELDNLIQSAVVEAESKHGTDGRHPFVLTTEHIRLNDIQRRLLLRTNDAQKPLQAYETNVPSSSNLGSETRYQDIREATEGEEMKELTRLGTADLIRRIRDTPANKKRWIKKEDKIRAISEALTITKGNRAEAAKLLRVNRSTVFEWVKLN